MNKTTKTGRSAIRRNALAVALAVSLGLGSGVAFGQSTTGRIFGTAAASQTVQVVSSTGAVRTTTASANGSYSLRDLPVGSYTVNVLENGEVVSTRSARVTPGAGTEVSFVFDGEPIELTAMEVSASALPTIDVSSATPTFTIGSEELEHLPLGQSADAIALMAPTATAGSNYFGGISFGGSGVTENAYYVNGWNTTGLYDYTGTAYDLPYGAIDQQQTLTGGFGAKYGRADGGVISQVGKRGTNEWHWGGRVQWVPRSLRSDPVNQYFPTVEPYKDLPFTTDDQPGDLYRYRKNNKSWNVKSGAYIGGPLVEDRLFVFIAAEENKDSSRSVGTQTAQTDDFYKNHDVKWYAKLDWNINDNNLFEYSLLKMDARNQYGETYRWNPETLETAGFLNERQWEEINNKTEIFHYTGYLTDAATVSVLYARSEVENPQFVPGTPSPMPFISGAGSQKPTIPGTPIVNDQTTAYYYNPDGEQRSNGLRVDFSYQLDNHLLGVGIDNMRYWAENQGQSVSGPGYLWIYDRSPANEPINSSLNVGAPGGDGYIVNRYIYSDLASMGARQKAWYIQDEWQVTSDVMLSLGLRNDSFDNYNPDGVAFVTQKDQWEPRVGFTWDVNGDSSFKLWGNAGRYFLALPQAVANRQATASTYTQEYFTYSGIDANGEPTGLVCVPTIGGTPGVDCAGPVSANAEFGQLPDPEIVAATNLKPQYQDEFIFGFDKSLGSDWVYGGNVQYRKLGTMIDDGCYPYAIRDGISEMGLDPDEWAWWENYCHLFNPNRTNVYKVSSADPTSDEQIYVPVSQELAQLPKSKRDYYAFNAYLEHPFDGTWFGRVDYTFSRSWGNSEGQVRSDIGQGDISTTEDWDYAELMHGASGYLANHVRHQLKAFGGWQFAPEWMLSGNMQVLSGSPRSCLGFYGPTPDDPDTRNPGFGYGSDYHWCDGVVSPPGERTAPWTTQIDLGITYRPAFADNKLAFKAYVFNVLNQQKPLQYQAHRYARNAYAVSTQYGMPLFYQNPRYVRFTVSYDY